MLFSSIYAPTLLCVHHLAWTNGERPFHRFSISSLFNLAIYTINGPNKQTNEPTPPEKKHQLLCTNVLANESPLRARLHHVEIHELK